MNILVTGVGGFIASHIARRLLREGHVVIGVDNFSSGMTSNVAEGVDLIHLDLADTSLVQRLPPRVDVILHLAGQSSGEISFADPVTDLTKNTISTINLIRYGIAAGAMKIVYASSMAVYGAVDGGRAREDMNCRPLSCYGVAKLAAENYLQIFAKQLPFTIFRIFNVYGPGQDMGNLRQGMVSIYLAQALSGGHVEVKGALSRYRDLIEIDDVIEAWVKACTNTKANNRVLNLGTGRRTTVEQLLKMIKQYLPETTWHANDGTPGDQSGIYADVGGLKEFLDFSARVDINGGLARFVDWARTQVTAVPN